MILFYLLFIVFDFNNMRTGYSSSTGQTKFVKWSRVVVVRVTRSHEQNIINDYFFHCFDNRVCTYILGLRHYNTYYFVLYPHACSCAGDDPRLIRMISAIALTFDNRAVL